MDTEQKNGWEEDTGEDMGLEHSLDHQTRKKRMGRVVTGREWVGRGLVD